MANIITVVQTISGLRAISGITDGDAINVDGYTTEGDGGGGIFYWNAASTTSDNGGTIIAPTGVPTGRWYRIYSGAINVMWFGATGNGSTDDTAAITAAITAVGSGDTVYFPPGTYIFPAALSTINSKNNIALKGAGVGATTVKSTVPVGTPASGDPVLMWFSSCTFIEISDITFDVNSILTTAANTYALAFSNCSDINFHDCAIINGTRLGIGFVGATNRFRVEANYLAFAGSPVGYYQNEAILVSASNNAVNKGLVRGNIIVGWGTLFDGNDIHVVDNIIDTFGYGAGITFNANVYTLRPVIIGNTISNGGLLVTTTGNISNGSAIITNIPSTTGMVPGNPISGTGIPAATTILTVDSSTQIHITANATATTTGVTLTIHEMDVNNTQAEGMEVWAPGAVIMGNLCYNNAASGITFAGENSVVVGNTCYNNGWYINTGSGIFLEWQPAWTPASYCVIADNLLFDNGPGYQQWGYSEYQASSSATFNNNRIAGNNAFGNTSSSYSFSPYSSRIQFDGYVFEGSASHTFGAVTKGNTDNSLTITVSGAALGDYVEASSSVSLAGLTLSAYVNATNSVQVLLFNGFNATTTLGATTISVRVHQHR